MRARPTRKRESRNQERGSITPFRDALKSFLRDSGLSRQLLSQEVYAAWSEACGGELAARARATRFADGTLLVEVQSAPHLAELKTFAGEDLRRAANRLLGSDQIRKVVFQLKR